MAEVVQAHVLDPGLASHRIPERKSIVLGTGGISDGRKYPGAVSVRDTPGNDFSCQDIQQNRSGTRLAIREFKSVAFHFLPAQAHNLAFPATSK